MTRKNFLTSMAGAAAALHAQSNKKRNIVLIVADDHRWDMLGSMEHPWLQTPHLDRLAKGGALFENAFVTTAECSASRASLVSGLYAHSHGILDISTPQPSGFRTFPQLLQDNGYTTAMFGKCGFGGDTDEPRPGWNRWISFRGPGVYSSPTLNLDGERKRTLGYITDLLTDHSRKFISQKSGERQPFFLMLSHKAAGHDFGVAERHRTQFANNPIPYPKSMANTELNYRGRPSWVRKQRESYYGVDGIYNRRMNFDQVYRDYCRTLLALDDSVGAILDELEKKRILEETVVVYTSDNGFLLGEHGLVDKRNMYEQAIRVPLILHATGIARSESRVSGMTLNIDLAPTLLEIAGVPVPQGIHGRSLMPLLKGEDSIRTEFLYEYFWDRDAPQTPTTIGVRTDKYAYMQYHGIWDVDELYDIQEDADQMNNLIGASQLRSESGRVSQRVSDPAAKPIVDDLQVRLKKLVEATGGRLFPRWS